MNCDGLQEVKERLASIDGKLEVYNQLLEVHIEATKVLKDDVANQRSNTNDIIKLVFEESEKNRNAMNRQLKIALGVFAALAVLVGALVPFIR
jgi:hypothetical protein